MSSFKQLLICSLHYLYQTLFQKSTVTGANWFRSCRRAGGFGVKCLVSNCLIICQRLIHVISQNQILYYIRISVRNTTYQYYGYCSCVNLNENKNKNMQTSIKAGKFNEYEVIMINIEQNILLLIMCDKQISTCLYVN